MMTATEIIDDLVQRGIHLQANGGRLIATGPHELLTPELHCLLKRNKATLLSLVRTD